MIRAPLVERGDLLLIDAHRAADPLAEEGVDDALVLDDQIGARRPALEFLVVAQRGHLLGAAAEQREAAEITAVRSEQDDLEILDLAVALQAGPVLDAAVEDFDARAPRARAPPVPIR